MVTGLGGWDSDKTKLGAKYRLRLIDWGFQPQHDVQTTLPVSQTKPPLPANKTYNLTVRNYTQYYAAK